MQFLNYFKSAISSSLFSESKEEIRKK